MGDDTGTGVGSGSGDDERAATDHPPRVFLSYAHESPEHENVVRDLWIFLRSREIDAKLDKPTAERRQDWPLWMLAEVRASDFVLILASPQYRRRSEGEAAADEGRGVQFEAALIREELYRDRPAAMATFLPVLLPGRSVEDIPVWLGPYATTHYPIAEISDTGAGMETLLRVLTGQPFEIEPPLGTRPVLPPRDVALPGAPPQAGSRAGASGQDGARSGSLTHDLVLAVRLADGRLTTRVLLAGTLLGERTGALPVGLDTVWTAQPADAAAADAHLSQAGHRLRDALFDADTARHITELIDGSPFGAVVDIVVEADGTALALPYELLRMAGGRLLATMPGVRLTRRVAGLNRVATAPLPGPLKILVAVAAPEETRTQNAPLDVEAEMQAIIDAVRPVAGSGAAQVTILEVAGLTEISEALGGRNRGDSDTADRDSYHVLHLSAHGSASSVELEDEDGNPVPIQAAELVDAIKGASRPLPLIVLSSCSGAAGGTEGLAQTLVRRGADRVVAMQTTVTDRYATDLARVFYTELASGRAGSVAAALAEARRRVDADRRASARATGRLAPPEYATATLLAAAGDPPLLDATADTCPLTRPFAAPAGGSVRELAMGDLVGRRREVRTALAVLRGGSAAVTRWGAVAGVVLTGPGGIGKTAVAGRVMARLRAEGWAVAVHVGRWNPPSLIAATAQALRGIPIPELVEARTALTDSRHEETDKIALIRALLGEHRLLLLFDDFEQNLTEDGRRFADPGFAEVFAELARAGGPGRSGGLGGPGSPSGAGRLLVTCRYPLPSRTVPFHRVEVGPLSGSELGRLLLRLPSLRALGDDDRRTLTRTIGGHPRLLEFVDALLRNGAANLLEVTEKIGDLADRLGIDLLDDRTFGEAVDDALLLGSRDIVLELLLATVTADERALLLQAAVSSAPMSVDDLAFAWQGAEPDRARHRVVAAAVRRLADRTLLLRLDGDVLVHPWIAHWLADVEPETRTERHGRAERMRLARIKAGRAEFADLVEVARHLAAQRRFDDVVAQALRFTGMLAGESSVAALLGEVVPMVPADSRGFLELVERELTALLNTGGTAAARDRGSAMVASARRLA
ncbi:CHAT domain-containing protein, partial [Frankia sp. Cr1]|uniref:CHAT domain-containing protein n=1 Tax=Frankia sp. Cr1 TaxID=3073931 RepID=UPI002AD2C667